MRGVASVAVQLEAREVGEAREGVGWVLLMKGWAFGEAYLCTCVNA